jgi:glycosyltransferase involved in cell wall biosynthesis
VLLHFTAPPVTGGVEAVIQAHAGELRRAGVPVLILAGRGDLSALPDGTRLMVIPEMDTQHPDIRAASEELERGLVPRNFSDLAGRLFARLQDALDPADVVMVHNVFSKHFNLPLTAALFRLMDAGAACRWVAWNHDLTWTSASSRARVHDGCPWDYLRTRRSRMTPVTVSRRRQAELAGLYGIPEEDVRVIYNGVDPQALLGISPDGMALVERLDLLNGQINLLMPVRVTQAKNIELALRVTAELVRMGANPRLVVTGPPDPHDAGIMAYYESLRALRSELGIEIEMRFVYEVGNGSGEPLLIDAHRVGELFRASDALFMPSHREGFGMPVLEAGLAGLAVFSTQAVPAAIELAGSETIFFAHDDPPAAIAGRILKWAGDDRVHNLRRRVRREYTWGAIFRRDIRPLLEGPCLA